MEFISSDTNVWLDFYYTDQLDLPFRLPYKYLMYAETIKSEILYPPELANELLDRGLVPVEITLEEFQQAVNK